MVIPLEDLNFSNAVNYHYAGFPPPQLDYNVLIKPLANATSALSRFDQMLTTLHNSELLLSPLRNQEAVISSRMEGSISTIDEILRFEADANNNETDTEGVRSDIIETILYQRALKAGQQALEDGRPFSERLVRALHEKLLFLGRGMEKNPGRYKVTQNYLADRTKRNVLFTPIKPEMLQEGLGKLFQYIEDSNEQILLKTAISHVEFEALHPFDDGNGRVGRMLITLLLWKAKEISAPHFYISGYLEENKDEYIDRMRNVSANADWTGWCLFFLKALEAQAKKNLEVATKISMLYENLKIQFSNTLSPKWSLQALDFVFANPIFRTTGLIANTQISAPSARRFVKALQEDGLLVSLEEAAGSRPALYALESLLKIIRV